MKKFINIITLFFALCFMWSCLDEPTVYPLEVTTDDNVEFIQGGVKLKGTISSEGIRSTIDRCGFCYSVSPNPTLSDSVYVMASSNKTRLIAGEIKSLLDSTTYYVRAFAQNITGVVYGEEIKFTTKCRPSVNTLSITDITAEYIVVESELLSLGSGVENLGLCYSSSSDEPTYTSLNFVKADKIEKGKYIIKISNLISNTKFWIRAYAVNIAGESYGQTLEVTTKARPIAETINVFKIGTDSATVQCNIDTDGESVIIERGICFGTESTLDISDSIIVCGSDIGNYDYILTNLKPTTQYYVRAYVKYDVDAINYGRVIGFKTKTLPQVSTKEVFNVTEASIFSGGDVISEDYTIKSRGICYSTEHNPTIEDNCVAASPTTGSFSSKITNLEEGKKYYIRAYVTYINGVIYGNEVEYYKSIIPTIPTINIDKITENTASCVAEIVSQDLEITERGVCYSTTEEPTINNYISKSGSGAGSFTANLTDLTQNTTYYVRAYAKYVFGVIYSEISEFKTLKAPEVTTSSVSNVTETSATCGGEIISPDKEITERGVCYGTSSNPTISNSVVKSGVGAGSYTCSLTGLTNGTTYYVRAYAKYSGGTIYGNINSFETKTTPIVTTSSVTNLTENSATCGGSVTSPSYSITERGICYGTSENPTVSNSVVKSGSGTGSFTATLSNLSIHTTYYARAYAKYENGVIYGEIKTFYTSKVPTITISEVTNITDTSASCGGDITSADYSITERGICYSTSSNPTVSNSVVKSGSGTGSYTCSLTGLTNGTTYYVRAYAKYELGVIYSESREFRTLESPEVTISSVSNETETSAICGATVVSPDYSITERGICYSTSSYPTVSNNVVKSGTGTGSFSCSLTGLTNGTTYYVRAYAKYSGGTIYGPINSFKTKTTPIVTTLSVTNITETSATCGGSVTSPSYSITERGVCYSTYSNPTVSNIVVKSTSGTGSFTCSLTGLTNGTTYYVRAYAKYSGGTIYGDINSFETLDNETSGNSIYIRGNGDWTSLDREFQYEGNGIYTYNKPITIDSPFKIGSEDWLTADYGSSYKAKIGTISLIESGTNIGVDRVINATKIVFNMNTLTLQITGTYAAQITLDYWTMCGVEELFGEAWNPASTANIMTETYSGSGIFELVVQNVYLYEGFKTEGVSGYGYKVVANGKWGVKEVPASGNKYFSVSYSGYYDLIFTYNANNESLSVDIW